MDIDLVKGKRIEVKERAPRVPYAEALELAHRIERLMATAPSGTSASDEYSARLAHAMTRSLIDQLADLSNSRAA